ncbi:tumor necrosis factor receptor superfamily member 9-like [Labrus mixtus]|uniref:tumor necrosis factor receptor superfamily member 9-like n=1 Tax=Labrus mixtus TaxID=508554 RepID=UPI0029BFF860|nr:tumor necrosis factor receptor superfamily member 9-like [Labrus mixtus]
MNTAVILRVLGLSLLMHGCLGSVGHTDTGCVLWDQHGDDVCCKKCHPGNRLVTECGPDPKKLCTPCERGTFTNEAKTKKCDMCRHCVEALVLVKECTNSINTVCGCREGLTCGNDECTFCVDKCGKGQEPTVNRSCRRCPEGTFNNQTHQKCKPWGTKCLNPGQVIVAKGDAFSDIKCSDIPEGTTGSEDSVITVSNAKKPGNTERELPLLLPLVFGIMLICFIVTLAWKIHKRRPSKEETSPKEMEEPEESSEKMIIEPPSDEPRTLVAVECSFHEAQQEQGSSLESLTSKDSSERLLP